MTLSQALQLNKRISILPRQLVNEIVNLDIEQILSIVENPSSELIYGKLDLFLAAIRKLHPEEPDENYVDIDAFLLNIKVIPVQKPINYSKIKYTAKYKRALLAAQKLPKTG